MEIHGQIYTKFNSTQTGPYNRWHFMGSDASDRHPNDTVDEIDNQAN